MDARLHLESIVNTDWNSHYLTNAGRVASRNYLCRAICSVLRHIPLIGGIFGRSNFKTATAELKQSITTLLKEGEDPHSKLLVNSADKINTLIDHVALKQPDRAVELIDDKIWIRNLVKEQHPEPEPHVDEEEDASAIDELPTTGETTGPTQVGVPIAEPETDVQPKHHHAKHPHVPEGAVALNTRSHEAPAKHTRSHDKEFLK